MLGRAMLLPYHYSLCSYVLYTERTWISIHEALPTDIACIALRSLVYPRIVSMGTLSFKIGYPEIL